MKRKENVIERHSPLNPFTFKVPVKERPLVGCNRPGCTKKFHPSFRGGREKKFCSAYCRTIHWQDQHPRVALSEVK